MLRSKYRIYGHLPNCFCWLPCLIEMRVICVYLPTYGTCPLCKYSRLYVMCLHLDMTLYMYVHKRIYLIIKYYEVKDKQVLYYIIKLSVRKTEKTNVSYNACTGRCFPSAFLIEPVFFVGIYHHEDLI